MTINITDKLYGRTVYASNAKERICYKKDSFETSSNLNALQINEIRFNGINYILLKIDAKKHPVLELNYSNPGHLICFALEGECNFESCSENQNDHNPNKCCIKPDLYALQPLHKSTTIKLNPISKVLFIHIDLIRFQGLNPIYRDPKKLSHSMNFVLSEILNCTHACPVKCIFIESKILSLLYIIFEELKNEESLLKKEAIPGLSEEDVQKLKAAKLYISQNIAKAYTLIDLAHQVGLNDFKLKKGFKELFGDTVFTYRHSLRMEKAREMLQSGYQVHAVSEEVGYKNPHHFSAAFKKHYNILPSLIKINKIKF